MAGDWLGKQGSLSDGPAFVVVWSYLVIFACVVVMLIGNRIVERDDHE
ncbi:MAG: hypothetical protein L0J73_03000 [Halomonas sp.]|nr:hypothetical protein [Halomonas sp.]